MNASKIGAAAGFAMLLLSGVAVAADDFVAQCTKYDANPQAEKVCTCASGKLAGGDRSLAIDAMKAVNTALASGKPEDAAAMTAKHAKGLELVMTAEMSCM